MMTTRAQQLMDQIWHERNTWADTETKLVAAVIRKTLDHARTLTASKMNDMQVIDKNDLITLSKEVEQLK